MGLATHRTLTPKASTMHAAARLTDPDTSHLAAQSVTNYHNVQHAILDVVARWGPLTDEDIADRVRSLPIKTSPSGLRTRRKELVALGMLVANPRKVRLSTGRLGTRWEINPNW